MLSWMALSLGIYLVTWFPQLPARGFSYCLAVIILTLILCQRPRWFITAMFLFGLLWGIEYGHYLLDRLLPEAFESTELWLDGEVSGFPKSFYERGQSGQQFNFIVNRTECREAVRPCAINIRKVKLKWYGNKQPQPGQHWHLLVKLKRPYGLANPGSRNFQTYHISQGFGAIGYVRDHDQNKRLPILSASIDAYRWRASKELDKLLVDAQHSAILKALLLGDRGNISQQQWALFSNTGTIHLMVISGLHIGLMAVTGFWLGYILSLLTNNLIPGVKLNRWSAVGAIVVAAAYSAAAGFTLPTQRALIVVTVAMLALFFGRQNKPAHTLSIALALCLLIDPLAPVGLSFWLSFCAVSVIVYSVSGKKSRRNRLTPLVSTQLAIFIGMLPLLGLLMGFVSVISPLCNLIAVPVFSAVVVPINALAGLASLFNAGWAKILWLYLDQLLAWIITALEWFDSWAGGVRFEFGAFTPVITILSLIAVVIMLAPKGLPARYLSFILLLPVFLYSPAQPKLNSARITVLDVGQGLSVVVQTARHTLVYDVGAANGNFSIARSVLLPYLRFSGISRIDQLVLSHDDNDHAGGWQHLVAGIEVTSILAGEPAKGSSQAACLAGTRWVWEGIKFEYLSPAEHRETVDGNNQSCVLKISKNKHAVLLTGDIERSREMSLLKTYGKQLQADLLIAPHHGSKTSSSWPFIRSVNPQHVIFATGYRNHFGHPDKVVAARYMSLQSKLYNTASTGAITFVLDDNGIHKQQIYRDRYQRYWL